MNKKTFIIIASVLGVIIIARIIYLAMKAKQTPPTNTQTAPATSKTSTATKSTAGQSTSGITMSDILFSEDMNDFINSNHTITV